MNDSMMKDEFTKLFKYMTKRFDAVDASLERLSIEKADKSSVDSVQNAVDGIYGRLDIVETEIVAFRAESRRNNEKYDNHEHRMTRLEKRTLGSA